MVGAKMARRAACVAIAGCLLAGMGASGGSAAPRLVAQSRAGADHAGAASHLPLRFYVLEGTTQVVSSRHDHLALTLRAENSLSGAVDARSRASESPTVDLSVALATHHNAQIDSWDFVLPGAALTANLNKSTGRLVTKSRIKPYGVIRLGIKPVGKLHTQSLCSAERETRRAVELHGEFLFNTAPGAVHSEGTVGSRKHPFSIRAVLMAEYSKPTDDPKCDVESTQPCPAAVSAQFFGPTDADGNSMSFIASPQGKSAFLEGSLDVELRKPHDAQRTDEVVTKAVQPVITPQQTGTSTTVTASGPAAAGSVTLDAFGAPTSYTPDYCKHPSTESVYNASVAANPTLRFHSRLAGTFAVPNGVEAAIYFTYQRD